MHVRSMRSYPRARSAIIAARCSALSKTGALHRARRAGCHMSTRAHELLVRAVAACAERHRIQAILDLSMPPVEPFVRRLAFETTVSPERAAVLIVRALRAIGRHADPTATAFVLSVTQPNPALKLDFEP